MFCFVMMLFVRLCVCCFFVVCLCFVLVCCVWCLICFVLSAFLMCVDEVSYFPELLCFVVVDVLFIVLPVPSRSALPFVALFRFVLCVCFLVSCFVLYWFAWLCCYWFYFVLPRSASFSFVWFRLASP